MSSRIALPQTSWGWGRPFVPTNDAFAFARVSWSAIAGLALLVPAGLVYMLFGSSCLAWVILFPILVALAALPSLAVVLMAHSRMLCPAGPGTPEKFWTFKDPAFEKMYKGKKIPIEELYEAYFDGKVDLKGDLLQTLYERDSYARPILQLSHVKFFLTKLIPELLSHSRKQDITQVRGHYDRGDDFYNAFLGETMIYTSGIFNQPDETLEESQRNKMELICRKVQMKEGDQHLDIGCGWGTFIAHAGKNYKTDSTGITLGKNQTAWANNTAEKQGVPKSVRALCMDYRDIPEQTNNKKYDKITCLEMAEHVGVKYFNAFLLQVKDMMKDDGIFYLQIAGLRRAWQYEDFCWGLFMGKYVFPGADASCPLGWVITQLEGAGFEVHSEETIGVHYSATLKRWYDNWLKNERMITEKYGVWWFRNWSWFLAWAVVASEQGSASCYQIVCNKNTNKYARDRYMGERKKFQL